MKFVIAFIFAVSFTGLVAQEEYELKDTTGGVELYGEWKRINYFKKKSPGMLCIKLVNKNEFPVTVDFALGFFKDGFASKKSETNSICLKPGQTRSGRAAGLCWDSEGSEKEDGFSWEPDVFEVSPCESCK